VHKGLVRASQAWGLFNHSCSRRALYEQGIFPSAFNPEHKWQFTLKSNLSGPNLITIDQLVDALKNCRLISKQLQDFNYDYSLKSNGGTKTGIATAKLLSKGVFILRKMHVLPGPKILRPVAKILHRVLGTRIDQTSYLDAIAQIQLIVEKR
jgi:hypothetical protein